MTLKREREEGGVREGGVGTKLSGGDGDGDGGGGGGGKWKGYQR